MDGFCFTNTRDNDVFKILEWVVMRNQPLSEVDDPLTRSLFNVKPVSSKSLRSYILSLTPLVEDVIKQILPSKFCVMFDGWSDSKIHYVAIFATYVIKEQYFETMLACAPLLQETDLSANQYKFFVEETLQVFDRDESNVVCFVGDNCAVNMKLSTITDIPIIGCNSHKLNLAIEAWIEAQEGLPGALKKLRELMSQLNTIKNSARLRQLTRLGSVLPNETRWTGKFEMVRRYFRIEKNIQMIHEVDNYMPTPSQRRSLESALGHFQNFESIAKHLQTKGLMLNNARFILDTVCEDYPEMCKYLAADASIVHDLPFEAAVIKIMDGNESLLTSTEKNSVKHLALDSIPDNDGNEKTPSSYAARIEAKRRRLSHTATSYLNCRFIPATSCTVERLFSAARWVNTCLRKHMSPILLESLLFLKLNRKHWDLKLVSAAMKIQPDDRYVSLDTDEFYE